MNSFFVLLIVFALVGTLYKFLPIDKEHKPNKAAFIIVCLGLWSVIRAYLAQDNSVAHNQHIGAAGAYAVSIVMLWLTSAIGFHDEKPFDVNLKSKMGRRAMVLMTIFFVYIIGGVGTLAYIHYKGWGGTVISLDTIDNIAFAFFIGMGMQLYWIYRILYHSPLEDNEVT